MKLGWTGVNITAINQAYWSPDRDQSPRPSDHATLQRDARCMQAKHGLRR
jgi:hypothetical protein